LKLPDALQPQSDSAMQALVDHSTDRLSRSPLPRVRVAGVVLFMDEIGIRIEPDPATCNEKPPRP
jgi:hypothetical protein